MVPPVVPNETVIVFVLEPAVIEAPLGTVQLYPVAVFIAAMEYVTPVLFAHVLVKLPVIVPAAAGTVFITTVVLLADPFPHVFMGVT